MTNIVSNLKKFIEERRNKTFWKPLVYFKDFLRYMTYEYNFRYFRYLKTKIIFLYISRVASTTLRHSLTKKAYFYETRMYDETKVHCIPPRFINMDKYSVFAFVRNPFDRIVSCYHLVKDRQEIFGIEDLNQNMSFKEFIKVISKIPDEQADVHFKSQHCFLMRDGKLLPQLIGRFERLEEDFNKICKSLKIDAKLLNKNRTIGKKPYQDYYDEETIKLVEERYKKDLEMFNYSFEPMVK